MLVKHNRVLVVVNKYWECDPLLALLLSPYDKALPADFPWPSRPVEWHCRRRKNETPPAAPHLLPRLTLPFPNMDVEVWCISDFLEHLEETGKYQSGSKWKMDYLPRLFEQPAELVIAMGTAGHPGDLSINGCVTIGTQVFLHDGGDAADRDNHWTAGPFQQLLASALSPDLFSKLLIGGRLPEAEKRLLMERNFGYPQPRIFADYAATALSFSNLWDYAKYTDKDRQAEEAFREKEPRAVLRSVETTHGLIRVAAGDRTSFMFVSGITDRSQYFADDVQPNEYAQNFTAAHNAAMVIAWMLPLLDKAFAPVP